MDCSAVSPRFHLTARHAYQKIPVLLFEAMESFGRVFGLVLAGRPRGEGAQESRPLEESETKRRLRSIGCLQSPWDG